MTVSSGNLELAGAKRLLRAPFRYDPVHVPFILMATDFIAISISVFIASLIFESPGILSEDFYSVWMTYAVLYYFTTKKTRVFSLDSVIRLMHWADDILIAPLTSFLFLASGVFAFGLTERFPLDWMATFAGLGLVAILLGRVAIQAVLDRLIRSLAIGRSVVVLGKGEQGRQFLQRFRAAQPHFAAVIGVYDVADDPAATEVEGYPFIGGFDELLAHARTHKIDDIVVTLPWNENYRVVELVDKLYELPVNVYLGADLVGFDLAFRPAIGTFEKLPMFLVQDKPISGWGSFLKSVEDYVIASIILILISPVMAMIALAIKIDSRGPVFFKQKRLGFNNKEFVIYKFRSMYHAGSPESVVRQASKGDARVTRVGRFIRATSLDELPQFLNVLNGTMSIVGPRPHALSHNEEYGRRIRKYFARHRVKPGITGWAQVNGLRGETEAIEKMEARIRHDIYYADNWSLMFDLRIIFLTVATVLFHKSAY